VVFLAGPAKGEVEHHLNDTIAVFLPTTPNPTSGFLLFVKRSEVTILDMSLEDAAKLVISGGLVTPDFDPANAGKSRKVKPVNPPEAA
jgi:uncharacterized membrane protein